MKIKNKFGMIILFTLCLAFIFAVAEIGGLVSSNGGLDAFNTTRDGANAGSNAFVLFSNSTRLVNGVQLWDQNLTSYESLNITMSFLRNGSHGGYTNVTFGIQRLSNGSYMIN